MERCDFSSVITIIRKYISDDHMPNQMDLLYEIFSSFLSDDEAQDFDLDNGLICRWINGQAKISPRISGYYLEKDHRRQLTEDVEERILPIMYDSCMAVQEVYALLVQDSTISDKVKKQLSRRYPCKDEQCEAAFLSAVLCFAMERTFVKRDARTKILMASGMLSPIVKDFIYNSSVPKPCRYFCGRDQEIAVLHELVTENGKVFLRGIAGIGKSELAKAYARLYSKEYTNILYISYTGDLKKDIIEMDFADDIPEDDDEERFRKHNRFLRALKEDTLLIVDNFNATETEDGLLSDVMKFRFRVLFTTRSRFDNYVSMELEELADREALLGLMGNFYSDAQTDRSILENIIETVHSHTLAVELAARLLEIGILDPSALLNKLRNEKAGMDASDTIGVTKDGKSRKATYYDHIHTLFSLYRLSDVEQDIMCSLVLMPVSGISSRLFANWLCLRNMNTLNDLIEKGFVQSGSGHMVALHSIIREVAIYDTKPTVRKCQSLLNSLHGICLRHGEDVPYYKQIFQTVENIVELIANDDVGEYLRFLEDVFPYMDKYRYATGMEAVLGELDALLQDRSVGTSSDRSLVLDYRATCETEPEKAIKLQQEAVGLLTEITEENALLAANLHANLGGLYRQIGNLELAKQNMEQGIRIMEQYALVPYHDSIPQIANYALLLTELGQSAVGLSALQKLSGVIREYNSDRSMDFAMVQETSGYICLAVGDIKQATAFLKSALEIYEDLFDAEPEMLESKKQEFLAAYAEAGMYLGEQLLNK